MKNNILKYIALIIITGTIVSCDDKIRELDDLNKAPEFQFFRKSSVTWETPKENVIQDSAKVYNASNNATYPAILRITDANNNISKIQIQNSNPEISFFVNGNTYFSNYEVTNNEEFNVAFRKASAGNEYFVVGAYDDFGKFSDIKFNIVFKENRPPKPVFSVVLVSGNTKTYQLVGESSFDIDKAIGGTIVRYEFIIDNVIINTSEPNINHVFSVGQHQIKFRVKDNDDVWSNYIDYQLTVN